MKKNLKKISWVIVPFTALVLVLCSQEQTFLKSFNFSSTNKIVEEDKASLESAIRLQQVLRNIARSISPAVVNIRTERIMKARNPFEEFFNDPNFRRFFGDPRGGQQERQQSLGSGIIISEDGYIISNNHVVAGADKITVYLSDKRSFTGSIVGTDEKTDIALIKVDTKGAILPVAPLGDSNEIQVGDFAIAIGNPFGLNWTFTFGVISATSRNEAIDENAPFKSYIQTDVSINPGNSGGPLVNIKGQVIGINSAIYSTSGGSIGIGFSIPINIVKNVVRQLIEKGRVERGYIGAYIQEVDEKLAKYYKLEKTEGVVLTNLEKDGPAEKAGLKAGDVVIAINDRPVESSSHLVSIISNTNPGETLKFTILRAGKKMDIPVKVGKRGSDGSGEGSSGDLGDWMGMQFGDLTKANRAKYKIPERITSGIVVISVKENSIAAEVGLQPGDVIDMINNQSIDNLSDFNKIVKGTKGREQFLLRVIRGGRIYFVVLENR